MNAKSKFTFSFSSSIVKIWLFVAVFLPLTLHLAYWQLERAEQKETLLEERSLLETSPAISFDAGQPQDVKKFQRFVFEGQYLNSYFLLDNQIRHGRVGYEVLSAFNIGEGQVILVNRGWVPAPAYREQLPNVEVPARPARIEGYFYWTERAMTKLSAIEESQQGMDIRLQTLEWEYVTGKLEQSVAVKHQFRLLNPQQNGAFQIDWKNQMMGPEKHLGYAFQWFSLAFVLVVLAVVASVKISRSDKQENRDI